MALFDKLTELAKVVTDQATELAKNATEIGGELAKNVADKTNDLLETGKINGQIASANTSIKELKTRLGDHYWNLYVQGEQLDDDAVVLCTTIKEYTEEIANLQAQLADLKAKREVAAGQTCQACGTVNNFDACFCKNCGVKLEIVDVEAAPVEEHKCCCGHHEGEEHECCCGHHEGEEHECCCGHHEGEEHECCCGHHEGEEHECCCGHHEGEEHECCCGHHEGEEHECCCKAEEAEEETVIEIAQNKICSNCQAENDPEHTFCNKCGAKL